MIEWLAPDFLFRNALLGGLGVALLCSVLGIPLLLRRLVLIGVALPQASATGIAAVFWLSGHAHATGTSPHLLALAGSLGATLLALVFLVAGRRRGRTPPEWGVAALFAVTSTATILFVAVNPRGDLEMSNLLRGELLAITSQDLAAIAICAAVVAALLLLFRREILLASFDPEFARSIGRVPWRSDALLYGLLGGGIALGVMNTGPLVVFGYLVLPPLAALSLAPGIGSAVAISVLLAAVSFLGGFAMALRADLPAGPMGVGIAAALWMAIAVAARVRGRRRALAIAGAMALLLPLLGCAGRLGLRGPEPLGPLAPGSLPTLDPERPISVLRIENATGKDLNLPSANPLRDLGRAAGDPFAARPLTVPDALQARAIAELARRGFAVTPWEQARDKVPYASDDALEAARTAQRAGVDGYILYGRLERFTITSSNGLLLVRLQLSLLDPRNEQLLWQGAATRPVPIRSSLTWTEVLIDAGGPIFADAFGDE